MNRKKVNALATLSVAAAIVLSGAFAINYFVFADDGDGTSQGENSGPWNRSDYDATKLYVAVHSGDTTEYLTLTEYLYSTGYYYGLNPNDTTSTLIVPEGDGPWTRDDYVVNQVYVSVFDIENAPPDTTPEISYLTLSEFNARYSGEGALNNVVYTIIKPDMPGPWDRDDYDPDQEYIALVTTEDDEITDIRFVTPEEYEEEFGEPYNPGTGDNGDDNGEDNGENNGDDNGENTGGNTGDGNGDNGNDNTGENNGDNNGENTGENTGDNSGDGNNTSVGTDPSGDSNPAGPIIPVVNADGADGAGQNLTVPDTGAAGHDLNKAASVTALSALPAILMLGYTVNFIRQRHTHRRVRFTKH